MNGPLLAASGLCKGFTLHLRGGLRLEVLRDLDLAVSAGECLALSGPSGAGKSTLLRALYGNYRVDRGRIFIRHEGENIDLAAASPETILAVRRITLGYVPQFLRVIPRVPAIDIVAEQALARGAEPAAARRSAAELLERLNIPPRLHALPPATFSGGEQQRVNLARVFVCRWPILLLDEPTASLDSASRDIVAALIGEAKKAGSAIVCIVHDAPLSVAIADRVLPLAPLRAAA